MISQENQKAQPATIPALPTLWNDRRLTMFVSVLGMHADTMQLILCSTCEDESVDETDGQYTTKLTTFSINSYVNPRERKVRTMQHHVECLVFAEENSKMSDGQLSITS